MEKSNIKYCVTSFTDLLGFSGHLEIGNDLRTNIGKGAIERLNILENAISLLNYEREQYPGYYPKRINFKRINDSIILTMDLPEYLTPRIGELIKKGITTSEIRKYFSKEVMESVEIFKKAIIKKHTQSILELTQFLGLVSRIHSFISRKEEEKYFPGPKTVIASGFRKSFIAASNDDKEDYFSANFSFSNAYIAESFLKGQKLFVDNNILELLSKNQFTKNHLKISSFILNEKQFDPFDDNDVTFDNTSYYKKGSQSEVILFRKKYLFREINPSYFAFFQLFPTLRPFLEEEKVLSTLENENYSFRKIFYFFKNKVNTKDIIEDKKHMFNVNFDIEDNIEYLKQLILTDDSSISSKNSFKTGTTHYNGS